MIGGQGQGSRIDADALKARADLVDVVGRYTELRKDGQEWKGLCPFHGERTPSFYVIPKKGFVHCFGCGAHHDVIGFVMAMENVEFHEACKRLGAETFEAIATPAPKPVDAPPQGRWIPLMPVPEHAPPLLADGAQRTRPVFNPKTGKMWSMDHTRADEYRDAKGRLLGYVMRVEFDDRKITPTVTWCVGPDGTERWCCVPFPAPRPLLGLDTLAKRPDAPVLVPEGEKCRAAGAGAFPMYAVVSWPGGSKGIQHVDWSALAGRDVVLWPDADSAGREAMLGWTDATGCVHRGVAQHARLVGANSIRLVDPEGMPKGWDIADALSGPDAWTPRQLAAWAASRVVGVEVRVDPTRLAR